MDKNNFTFLGTNYGGYFVNLGEISDGALVFDLGVGEDMSFVEELHKLKNIRTVSVDPTEKSLRFIQKKNLDYVNFIFKAVWTDSGEKLKLFKHKNPDHVSDSVSRAMHSVCDDFYFVDTVSIRDLVSEYGVPDLIKMDIEGAEYSIYHHCFGVKQVAMEIHDIKQDGDRTTMIESFRKIGYSVHLDEHGATFLKS